MTSSSRPDLDRRYRRFVAAHPLRDAAFSIAGKSQRWSWIDSGGGAEVVLLLPGFMGEADTSFLYTLALEDRLRVLSVTYPSSAETVDHLCDGLIALLDHLRLPRVHVLGGSYSGYIAQVLVRRHPGHIRRLILTHTGLPSGAHARTASVFLFLSRMTPTALLRWIMRLSRHFFLSPSTSSFWKGHFSDVIGRQSRESLLNRFRIMRDFHTTRAFHAEDLTGWRGSLLIMEMARDDFASDEERSAMHRVYPQAAVHTFPQTGHMDSVEHPEEQICVIKDFFQAQADENESRREAR